MRILVLGAGAVGGYFGARIHQAGGDVTFMVRPVRVNHLATNGLKIFSPFGNVHFTPKIVSSPLSDSMEKFDVVILSCKAYDLDMAIDSLAPALDSKGIVLPLLNGFAHLTRLDTQFGRERVLGGFAHISAILASEGEIRHLNDTHRLVMGSRSRAASPLVHVLAELLADSNMNFSLSENIESEMKGKYIFLATLAAVTCTMRSAIGDILQTHSGKAFILGLFNECVAIANGTGFLPNPQQLDDYRNQLTMAGSTSTASMLRDLEQGRRIEADHILGDMVRRAEALGIDIPFLKIAYSHLQAYEIRKLCQ